MALLLERSFFEISRAAEYFTAKELQAQTGQPVENFATVALKELVDNALDACETAGVQPVLGIDVDANDGLIQISVQDNGHGIDPTTIERILNFDTRTSDKSAYRAPTRGAQGNALKTILGMPCALQCDMPVSIESRDVRHSVRAWIDPAGELRIDHAKTNGVSAQGTKVVVTLPAEGQEFYPGYWGKAFSLFNPHAQISSFVFGIEQANSDENENGNSYQPTQEFPGRWRKFLPTDLTSPHWYNTQDLAALIFSHVAEIRKGGKDLTLRSFVKQFRGLSPNAKAKAVCDGVHGISKLSDCDELRSEEIQSLLETMQASCDPPAPTVLGMIGEDHFKTRFDEWYGVERSWYKKVTDTLDGIPFVFEVFVAETEDRGPIFGGVNFSPTFEDPFAGQPFSTERFTGYGINGFLESAYVREGYTAAAFHLTCPSLQFMDRGKTRLARNHELKERITPALWKVSKVLFKEEKRRQRDASSQKVVPISRGSTWNLKEAVFDVLPKAIAAATGDSEYPVSARTLYYQVRPLIQAYTSKPLNYDYFSQTLLTDYQYDYGEIEQLYYDPRGVLYEPHTGDSVPLGTREVDAYDFPAWVFNKILYVEKKGLWPILKTAKLAERYDMGVVAAEGYANEAVRTLFEHADQKQGYQLFVLHDADPYGYNIARTLQNQTHRMRGYEVDVFDLGLKIGEAIEVGLQTEEFTRKNDLPYGLELNEIEKRMFIGKRDEWGRKSWVCQRVELNALSAPELVAYIERKLEEAGAYPKVIPDHEALPELSDDIFQDELNQHIQDVLDSILSVSRIQGDMARKFKPDHDMARQWIEEAFERDSSISWKEALRQRFERHCLKQSKKLHDAVRTMVAKAIA